MVSTEDSRRVDEFVRLAEQSVQRLVSDPEVAEALGSAMAAQPGDDDLDRLLRAQQVLARVMAFERVALGGHRLSAGDVEALQAEAKLDLETQVRLLYELSLGDRTWQAVDEASPAPDDGLRRRDPVLLALRTQTAGTAGEEESAERSAAWHLRRPSLRRAAERARTTPLGFCRLVVEEADALGEAEAEIEGRRSALAYVSVLLDDPFLRRESPRHWFDLRALCGVYLADRHRRTGRREEFQAQLESLPALLDAGTGDAELQASLLELQAAQQLNREKAAENGPDHGAAVRLLLRAEELLADASEGIPADRRIEVQLKRAHVLGSDAETRDQAAAVLEDALARLESLDPQVHPKLHRRARRALARVELDRARQTVADRDPFRHAGDESGAVSDLDARASLAAYAAAWQDQAPRLDRARQLLDVAEPLEMEPSSGEEAERDWLLGRALLLADPDAAADHLRSARSAFRELGEENASTRVALDLIACRVVAATAGEEIEDWSEPLRLFDELRQRP